MGFSNNQVKALETKLNGKHVKTRDVRGKTLSYVEGWHVIAEANRVFGFDAWDRETLEARCVWEGASKGLRNCSYVARVRVRVRAGKTVVIREGSGFGNGRGSSAGEAHEVAIKEAETDAMKRALSTFGNPFGLALYDKQQRGVRRSRSKPNGKPISWVLLDATGEPLSKHEDPVAYCTASRKHLEALDDADVLMSFWARNQDTVAHLRTNLPDLKTEKGQHYGEILGNLYTARLQEFAARKAISGKSSEKAEDRADEVTASTPQNVEMKTRNSRPQRIEKKQRNSIEKGPRRVRDPEHLKFVASRNCVVCGRNPSQAHHIRFAQPRALSRKVSDEWAVPLCAIHHRALHDSGDEKDWWQKQELEPLKEAERLWRIDRRYQNAS